VGLQSSAERWRQAWRARTLARLASAGALPALVPALALGDRSQLRSSTRDAFRELGLAHLIALSGLHIVFIAGLAASGALLATGLVCRGRGPFVVALVVGCIAAAGFAWWVGAPRSVQRAALAFALFALPRAAGRALRPEAVLVWVAWMLALADPAIVFDPAARLSFAACAGLLLAQPGGSWMDLDRKSRVGKRRAVVRESISAGLVVAAAAGLATAPLLFASGGSVAPWAPLANAVAVPFTGLLVLPGAIAAAFGASSLPGATLRLLVWPAELLEAVIVALADRLPARLPSAEATWSIEWSTGLVVVGLLALRRRRLGIVAGCWLAVSMIGGTPLPGWPGLAPPPRILFFDMGQGDAVLIEGRSGRLLVDSGGGPPDGTGGGRLLRALRALGVSRIDSLVITHADMDHRGGARTILSGLEVEELVLPDGRQGDAPLVELAERAQRGGARVRWLAAGDRLFAGADLSADVLWPERGSSVAADSRNDASLVLEVGLAGRRLLLMADTGVAVERALIAAGRIQSVDVLKIGHHGSRHSTGEALLRTAAPRIGLLTAPCDARRGLPSGELFGRLEDERARLLWTGRDGAIALLLGRHDAIEIERWASPRGCRAGGQGEARGLDGSPG
jgi:competence protein ComEC